MSQFICAPSSRDPAGAIHDFEIPATKPWSHILRKGQTLRIVDSYGQQAVDTLFYNAEDFSERYSANDTLREQGSAYVVIGTALVSNEGRVMARIVANTGGAHDTSAGACSCESNTVRFGHHVKYQHACRENFVLEVSKYGMGKRDVVPNINFFMNVPVEPDGNLAIVDGESKPGDYVELVAEMDILCVISNCPQINNPCNGFIPTPVRALIWEALEA
ncbi:urea amidolyase associated protein UAAP2 [Rhodoblastus sp.]|uniref:urea amidolyase associated protein UAAP2 n=1 Tax=Rhodoblastus sp. TaxID=1962975 RepID=UPI0035B194A5